MPAVVMGFADHQIVVTWTCSRGVMSEQKIFAKCAASPVLLYLSARDRPSPNQDSNGQGAGLISTPIRFSRQRTISV
jgi:hypothetical protein